MKKNWKRNISVGNRTIGAGSPIFIIAEAGSNHDGDFDTACKLIKMAKWAGADAVKFQLFHADTLVNRNEFPEAYDKVKAYQLPYEWVPKLIDVANNEGIIFLATPFDFEAVKVLQDLKIGAYKIASGDMTYHSLVEKVAKTQIPIILSTGMSELSEVRQTLEIIHEVGNNNLLLLHCVVNYPASSSEQNLKSIVLLQEQFGCPVGFSDHTLGDISALGAVALGACVLEKHFTLKRRNEGMDHPHSTEPEEFKQMVARIRELELAMGESSKVPQPSEMPKRIRARRGVYASKELSEGTQIDENNVIALRPMKGVAASEFNKIAGKKTTSAIPKLKELTVDLVK